MSIKSYLAFPVEGEMTELKRELSELASCAVIPSDQENVLILVTDTECKEKEKGLMDSLDQVKSLACLSLVSAWSEDIISNTASAGELNHV